MSSSRPTDPPTVRASRLNCLAPLVYLVAGALTFGWFVLTPTGQAVDAAALGATLGLLPFDSRMAIFGAIRAYSWVVLAIAASVAGAIRLRRGQWRPVVDSAVSLFAVVIAVELLRESLGRPELGIASYRHNTWPSVNVAVASGLALACTRLSPLPRRPLFSGALACFLAVVGYASVTTSAHRPSDVLAAILIAGAGFAVTRGGGPRQPGSVAEMIVEGMLVLFAVAALGTISWLWSSGSVEPASSGWACLLAVSAVSLMVILPERPPATIGVTQ